MKSAFALAVLAAFVAAAYGAPAPQAVDWAGVSSRVDQIEAAVVGGVQQVVSTAKADNAAVGAEIERQIAGPAANAREVLERARVDIRAETLTRAQAEQHFAELKAILAGVQEDISENVRQLSPTAQDAIRATLANAYALAERLANEIYALLDAAILAVDWAGVSSRVDQIEAAVVGGVQQVVSTAKADNAAVGAEIERQIAGPAANAREVLERARVAIRAETLTLAQAEQHFAELKAILAGVQADISENVAKLSSTAQEAIRATLANAYALAERLANEIYALLQA